MNDLDKHFKNLLQKDCNLAKQDFPEPRNTKPIDCLIQKITLQEIKESIKYLKTKKAPGLDNITNEMIKCSDRNMIERLQTLFNNIMESDYYSTSWNQRLICSIYKSGKKEDPLGNFSIQSYIIGYKMNFKKILFCPLPKLDFEKITELLITSSRYSV